MMILTLEECYMILEHRYKNGRYNSESDATYLLEVAKTFTDLIAQYVEEIKGEKND